MIEELYLLQPREAFNFEEFLSGLEQFKFLKVLYQNVIWSDLGIEKDWTPALSDPQKLQLVVNERIQILARRCPSLTQISHPNTSDHYIAISSENGLEVSTRVEYIFQRPLESRFEMDSYRLWEP
ncbi:hypothetical protein BDN72DRAFT_471293 [Pluteus cervinus]|uniref:Uncharacterized protein n=1 Tax=Pluteus cervinus TaxID=181527 RepID=A0ACD3A6J7_9AGAR|nr:hypothetical protein BDN72DRAFT_471293 [Pluteus cervinus]